MSKSRAKGTSAEVAIVAYLNDHGFPYAERRALAGINDRGDIAGVPGVVIEAKNCETITLSAWLKEAATEAVNAGVDIGVVWAKRRGKGSPGDWYVIMPGSTFVELIK